MAHQPPENNANGNIVGTKCCACQKSPMTGSLRFPKNPSLRETWVATIMAKTADYPGKAQLLNEIGLQICIEHFEPAMLFQKQEGGQVVTALKKGGVPTVFDDLNKTDSSQLTNGHSSTRPDSTMHSDEEIEICYEMLPTAATQVKPKSASDPDPEISKQPVNSNPEENADHLNNGSTLVNSEMSKNNVIHSLQEFMTILKLKEAKYYEPWRILYSECSVQFFLLDTDCKYLIQSFTVDKNFKVSVFYHGQPFMDHELTLMLGDELKLDTWTKFKKLVLFLHTSMKGKQEMTMKLKNVCSLLQNCIEIGDTVGCSQKQIKKLKFAMNQIEISNCVNPSYSAENLQWAMQVYSVNRQGYAKIYESDCLTLPHPASLELFKRQTIEQAKKQLTRPKILARPSKPYNCGTENGTSPSPQQSSASLLRVRTDIHQGSSLPISSNGPITLPRENGLQGSIVQVMDCEIQEI